MILYGVPLSDTSHGSSNVASSPYFPIYASPPVHMAYAAIAIQHIQAGSHAVSQGSLQLAWATQMMTMQRLAPSSVSGASRIQPRNLLAICSAQPQPGLQPSAPIWTSLPSCRQLMQPLSDREMAAAGCYLSSQVQPWNLTSSGLCLQLAIPGSSGAQLPLPVDESGIAWSSDIRRKFGSQLPSNFNLEEYASNRGGATINGEAAVHLQVEDGTWALLAVIVVALAICPFRLG